VAHRYAVHSDNRFLEKRLELDDVGIGRDPAVIGKQRAGCRGKDGIILEDRAIGIIARRDDSPAHPVAQKAGDLGIGQAQRLRMFGAGFLPGEVHLIRGVDGCYAFERDADPDKLGRHMGKTSRRSVEVYDQTFHRVGRDRCCWAGSVASIAYAGMVCGFFLFRQLVTRKSK
jgi:hypothetical protein